MYKGIITIEQAEIERLDISAQDKYDWVDAVLRNKADYVLPTKTRMPLRENDYFNVMPCVLPSENVLGLKVVTRNENRRKEGLSNIDGDILLYSYHDFLPKALIDGAYITTVRTAAVAVHSMLNLAPASDTVAMIGLGNIGTEIGNILFGLLPDKPMHVKLFRYKDHAEKFVDKFSHYSNLHFTICDSYEDLMQDSDVVFSSVTYVEDDFCDPSVYKPGCTVIPVHLRGFRECDRVFDHVITSDLISIRKFANYAEMKKISYWDDLFADIENYKPDSRTLVYNLGLAVYDLYFAAKIYEKILRKA
ncbi:MAG: hypothetical protein K2F64_02630 [Muribaculaceae bacterium]|nr:hypothetical protein [Muribaculaceae bacterium]